MSSWDAPRAAARKWAADNDVEILGEWAAPRVATSYIARKGPHEGHTIYVRKVTNDGGKSKWTTVSVECVPCRARWGWVVEGFAERMRIMQEEYTPKTVTFVDDGDGGALLYVDDKLVKGVNDYDVWEVALRAMRIAGIEVLQPQVRSSTREERLAVSNILWDQNDPRFSSLKELKEKLGDLFHQLSNAPRKMELQSEIAKLQKEIAKLQKELDELGTSEKAPQTKSDGYPYF